MKLTKQTFLKKDGSGAETVTVDYFEGSRSSSESTLET
jgi:hypothetical protein